MPNVSATEDRQVKSLRVLRRIMDCLARNFKSSCPGQQLVMKTRLRADQEDEQTRQSPSAQDRLLTGCSRVREAICFL